MRESLVYRPKIGKGMKQRFARIKLLYGGYVGVSGRPQSYAGPAAIFRYEDAQQFLRDTRLFDRSDYLWGASVEMLEKRKTWTAITEEQFKRMLATATLVRLEGEAARYERLSSEAYTQIKHYTERALHYASKANEIRHQLEKK